MPESESPDISRADTFIFLNDPYVLSGATLAAFYESDNKDAFLFDLLFKIFVNEGYSAGASIWLYDVRFVDVENPDVNLQANWLTEWKGKDGGADRAEIVDVDLTKFAAIDYTNKMLHLVSREWGEHGTTISANNLREKNMRLTYYFKGDGGNLRQPLDGDYAAGGKGKGLVHL